MTPVIKLKSLVSDIVFYLHQKMLDCQKYLFSLPEDIHYLNAAYMSPLPKATEAAGIMGLKRKCNPISIKPADFFEDALIVKRLFANLIHANEKNIAITPSASYGLATVFKNINPERGDHVLLIEDEFPSIYYTASAWSKQHSKEIKIVNRPSNSKKKAADWNEHLLNSIGNDTIAVALSPVHWMDGSLFSMNAIGERCRQTNTFFIIDGTQFVGAYPLHVQAVQAHAIVCAGYKWLLGPYSTGLTWLSEELLDGEPIEQSWMIRNNASNFSSLTNYNEQYVSGAARFDMGEYSNFIAMPMLKESLQQLSDWSPEAIQFYCNKISSPFIDWISHTDLQIEESASRAAHLFGIKGFNEKQAAALTEKLQQEKVFISVRGNSLRIAPHVYNDVTDFGKLQEIISTVL